jgi:hypothetical protein
MGLTTETLLALRQKAVTKPAHTVQWSAAQIVALCDEVTALRARVADLEARIPTRIYCRVCGDNYPILIDEPRQNAPGDGDDTPWGDICCGRCSVVLVTVEYGNWPAAPEAERRAPRGAEGE